MGKIYFFKHKQINPIKIGMTNDDNVLMRFNSFKTYSPFGAEILGTIDTDNPYKLENELHKKFKDKRLNGEFFNITVDDVNYLIDKHDSYGELQNLINRSSETDLKKIIDIASQVVNGVKKYNPARDAVISMNQLGVKNKDIANKLGISKGRVSQILNNNN